MSKEKTFLTLVKFNNPSLKKKESKSLRIYLERQRCDYSKLIVHTRSSYRFFDDFDFDSHVKN